MALRGDFHIHTSFSGDCDVAPRVVVDRCREVGLNCIAITDHNSIRGALEVRELADFAVIVGEEVKSSKGDIIGLFLEEEIPKGLPPLETVHRIKDQGGLVVVPHPFDTIRRGPLSQDALSEVLPYVDLIEVLNARTILPRDLEKCRRLAAEASLAPVAVSDAHTPGELGEAYTELEGFNGSALSFKDAVKAGRVCGRRSTPLVHLITAYVKVKKRLLA
jgi:predicted metal-dependent phosphoesterase TrpH